MRSELPQGWVSVPLEKIVDQISYGLTAKADHSAIGPKFLRITDIQDGQVFWDTVPRCSSKQYEKYKLRVGDIVFARTGATTGKSYLLKKMPEEAVFASYLIRARIHELCEPQYVYRYFQTAEYWDQIHEVRSGIAQPGVNATKLSRLKIPLPPFSEQRRIVAKLDSLFERTGRAREELSHVPLLIEHYRHAILEKAFRGDLTADWRHRQGISGAWSMETIRAAISDIRYGTSKKCTPERHGTPVLRIPNVTSEGIDIDDLKFTDLTPKEIEKLSLRLGDILVVRSNGSVDLVGRSVVVGEQVVDYAYAGYLIRLRPNLDTIDPAFMEWMLRSPQTRKIVEVNARSTSGVHNINSEELQALLIPIPSVEEQKESVRLIQKSFDWLATVSEEVGKSVILLDHLDQAHLAKAFRGEIVPQDPGDVPASALLERIRAERAAQPRARRGRRGKAATGQEAMT